MLEDQIGFIEVIAVILVHLLKAFHQVVVLFVADGAAKYIAASVTVNLDVISPRTIKDVREHGRPYRKNRHEKNPRDEKAVNRGDAGGCDNFLQFQLARHRLGGILHQFF